MNILLLSVLSGLSSQWEKEHTQAKLIVPRSEALASCSHGNHLPVPGLRVYGTQGTGRDRQLPSHCHELPQLEHRRRAGPGKFNRAQGADSEVPLHPAH